MNDRQTRYRDVIGRIQAILDQDCDWIAAMATVACELHHAFDAFHWTGFYRKTAQDLLTVGPYQGDHGCLRITFDRGVCGAAARSQSTQRVDNVRQVDDHIACSATTRSEIVVPVVNSSGELTAVLDIDSNQAAAFDSVDQRCLEQLCQWLARTYHRRQSDVDPLARKV